MEKEIRSKAKIIGKALRDLGKRLEVGNSSELLVWVIPGLLACAHRPLRHHPRFGGSGRDLPPEATNEVVQWVKRMHDFGIRSIVSLMHPKELQHYSELHLDAKDLIDFYRRSGFETRHIPWEDPAHRSSSAGSSFREELMVIREKVLDAFDELPEPVLLHCSAGIDRSSPVAAYVWWKRAGAENSKNLSLPS